jgi:hypothetical protein
MTGLRIKILKSKGRPVRLAIRIKRLFSRIAAWFHAHEGQAPVARSPGLQIRVLNNSEPATGQSRATNNPRPSSSTAGSGPSRQPQRTAGSAPRGIVFNEGERKCKTCGEPLLNGRELVECSENPAHKIHSLCVGLAGHRCPDCQAALG